MSTTRSHEASAADAARPSEDSGVVRDDIADLTLDEKAALTAGVDMWMTTPIERLGISSIRLTDGPSGARGRWWGASATRAASLPTGSALGATWDVQLLAEVGAELGRETRARAAQVLLGPTVNPQRAPLAGRTFECFSEDPLLSGMLGAAYVGGVQGEGVAATVKHLAGNEAEWQRNSVDSIIDERTLREVYLLPFEHCVRAGALAVMTAYNRLNGDHCTNESWLLDDILRGEWGFKGIVMTDWWGVVDTVRAARAGLDLEMPGPARAYGARLAEAVRDGALEPGVLDRIVDRLLSTFQQLDSGGGATDDRERSRDSEETRRFARRTAAAAMVLVKNDGTLPLALGSLERVAIIGPNAGTANIMGGGSSQVRAAHRTTPVMALRHNWMDRVEIEFEPGCGSGTDPTPLEPWELTNANGDPGFLVEYWGDLDMRGEPDAVHEGDDFRIQYLGPPGDGIPYPHFAARAAATFTASVSGLHHFVLRSNADARLLVDGVEVADLADGADADWFGALREFRWSVGLTEGEGVNLAVEFVNPPFDTYGRTSLSCLRPVVDGAMHRAIAAAGRADVAIVIVGTSDLVESEGYDRSTLALPPGQDELVERVAAENPRTVVVVNSGGPVAMPWLDRVSSVVQAWFGGQELGHALADVLDGSAEPAGRMPFTVPRRIEDTPTFGNFPGESGAVRYGEGLLIGHRWYDTRDIPVAVPFGHGGSYTTFSWSHTEVVDDPGDDEGVAVEVTVVNTGARPGSDVVQLYVTPPLDSPLFRPSRELKGFAKVHLGPGESRRVRIPLDWRAFAFWTPHDSASVHHDQVRATPFASTVPTHVPAVGWTVHPGTYQLHVARSVVDVHSTLQYDVTEPIEGRR